MGTTVGGSVGRAVTTGAVMTTREVADYLGREVSWVRALLADGSIPGAYRHPKGSPRARWLVPRAQVEAWVAQGCPENLVEPIAPPMPCRTLPFGRAA